MLDIVKVTNNHNGNGAVNGRGARRRKLTDRQRIVLATDVALGLVPLQPSIKTSAAAIGVSPADIRAELKARTVREAKQWAAEARWRSQEEAEAVNAEADSIVSAWRLSSPEAREAAFRTISAAAIWDVLARIVA
jgi:hypothetical protein